MYFVASDLFRKNDKYVSKTKICIVCVEFFCLHIFQFSKQLRWLFLFVHQKSWKHTFKISFSVHNIILYLCWQVENTKRMLCSQKTGIYYINIGRIPFFNNCISIIPLQWVSIFASLLLICAIHIHNFTHNLSLKIGKSKISYMYIFFLCTFENLVCEFI